MRHHKGWAAVPLLLTVACSPPDGTLELRVVDSKGMATPARIEIVDDEGRNHVAADALEIRTECATPPLPDWASAVQNALHRQQSIDSPYSGTTQFYTDGDTRTSLPAGRYRIVARKGIEYRTSSREFEVAGGETTRVSLALERWIDMPRLGWYSADDHIHVTRHTPADNASIGKWMRAEDVHVANLLRMGTAEHFAITPQYAFGDAGVYRDGDSMLVSGQEHPRTHVLGHTIILGAEVAIDRRDSYAVYQNFWKEAAQRGGASGYAHWGTGQARDGLAVDAPSGLLSFVEVLQFDFPYYEIWYELLNLGIRLAPTAGTDFPCIPSIPGRERFYTKIDGVPDRGNWVEGLRRGRTFVTNGPMLEFEVGGAGIGDELRIESPGVLRIRGRVRFDPARDDVQALELIRDGQRVAVASERSAPGEIVLEIDETVDGPAWFALRASGDKIGETRLETPWFMGPRAIELGCKFGCGASLSERVDYVGTGRPRPSAAHTAPIYVAVADTQASRPTELLRRWISRLDALEASLSDEHFEELLVFRPFASRLLIDGVPAEALRRDRPALRALIASARGYYRNLLAGPGAESGG